MDTSPFSLKRSGGDIATSAFHLKGMGMYTYIYVNYIRYNEYMVVAVPPLHGDGHGRFSILSNER